MDVAGRAYPGLFEEKGLKQSCAVCACVVNHLVKVTLADTCLEKLHALEIQAHPPAYKPEHSVEGRCPQHCVWQRGEVHDSCLRLLFSSADMQLGAHTLVLMKHDTGSQ